MSSRDMLVMGEVGMSLLDVGFTTYPLGRGEGHGSGERLLRAKNGVRWIGGRSVYWPCLHRCYDFIHFYTV